MEPIRKAEITPVDDVRQVRENLSAEFGNDVQKLAEHARCVTEELRTKLGLKLAPKSSDIVRREP